MIDLSIFKNHNPFVIDYGKIPEACVSRNDMIKDDFKFLSGLLENHLNPMSILVSGVRGSAMIKRLSCLLI